MLCPARLSHGDNWPHGGHERRSCQVGVGGLLPVGNGTCPPIVFHGPFPEPVGRLEMVGGILLSVTSSKYWPPPMMTAGATPQPVGLRAGHDQSNWLGCHEPSQEPSWGHAENAASI
jgi:hypothetical protein